MKHRIAILLLLSISALAFLIPSTTFIQLIVITSATILFLTSLIIGITTMKWNYFFKSKNAAGKNKICFTFDDGPHENTIQILGVLKKYNIKASFFVIGKNCKSNPEILKQLKADNHIIGNHSFSHTTNLGWASTKKIEAEINQTNQIIQEITGIKPTFYRPPFGITNPNIARAIQRTQMKSVGWTIRSFDTMIHDSKKLLQRTRGRINSSGHILLMHDTYGHSAQTLEELILDCQKKGIKFVNLNDTDFV